MRHPSYCHRGSHEPLLGSTIGDHLAGVVATHAPREALVSVPQQLRLTYQDLAARVDAIARGLLALGIDRGDRVGMWSTDNAEWVLVQMATARIGAILVNVNPAYRTAELVHALKLARVQTLFAIPSFRSSHYLEMLGEFCPDLTVRAPGEWRCTELAELRTLVVFDPDRAALAHIGLTGALTWSDLLARGADVPQSALVERAATLDPDDPINIQFTSGTTGAPKAVLLTHHNILNNAVWAGRLMHFAPGDRLCVPVPFYHCFGMVVSTLTCLAHGATIVIPAPHFDPEATLAAIASERCTAVHGVPTMFIAQLEHPNFARYDLGSLRTGIIAGAPCPPELIRRITTDMHCPDLLIGYGQTEASPITHQTRADDTPARRTTSVGTNLPHTEAKVVDVHTGATVPCGEQGEVCVRGYHVMRGYFEQQDATARTIDVAGWLHTGDLGVMDDAGYLTITGRLKDMIIRGGENVYPAEIEAVFHTHPKVADVAVFGVADPRLGEDVAAWVRLHEGEHADREELREFARARMAHFKVPRHLWIVQEFPMTVTGKIQKFKMRDTAEEWLRREAPSSTARGPAGA
ncbi:MAG: AMP-binding protein [Planctomycetota bacterium]